MGRYTYSYFEKNKGIKKKKWIPIYLSGLEAKICVITLKGLWGESEWISR